MTHALKPRVELLCPGLFWFEAETCLGSFCIDLACGGAEPCVGLIGYGLICREAELCIEA